MPPPPSKIPNMYSIELIGLVRKNINLPSLLSKDTFIVMSAMPPPITEKRAAPMITLGQFEWPESSNIGVIIESGMNIVMNMYVRGRLKNHLA